MCDIYMHPCKVCKEEIEMHLGDWNTSADEIEVYCKNHIPEHDVVIWDSDEINKQKAPLSEIYTNGRVGVRALTENAKLNKECNHPNAFNAEIVEERT
jgi:hypothetical protein